MSQTKPSPSSLYDCGEKGWKNLIEGYYHRFHVLDKTTFSLYVTNFEQVWCKTCSDKEIQSLSETYCPQLSMDTCDLVKLLHFQFNDPNREQTGTVFSIENGEIDKSILVVCVNAELQLAAKVNVPFHWKIECISLNILKAKQILSDSWCPEINVQSNKNSMTTQKGDGPLEISSIENSNIQSIHSMTPTQAIELDLHTPNANEMNQTDIPSSSSSHLKSLMLSFLKTNTLLEESKYLKKEIMDPMISIISFLCNELSQMKEQIQLRDNQLSKIKDLFGDRIPSHIDVIKNQQNQQNYIDYSNMILEEEMKSRFEKDPTIKYNSFHRLPALFHSLYDMYIKLRETVPQQITPELSTMNSVAAYGSDSGGSCAIGEVIMTAAGTEHGVRGEDAQVQSSVVVETQEADANPSSQQSSYLETENEKKRKRDIEQQMQAKKQKREKQQEKKKIKKAFA